MRMVPYIQSAARWLTLALLLVRVRQLRTERGLTQRALAEITMSDPAWLSTIETGNRGKAPNLETVIRLARALGVEPSEVLCVLDG